MTQRRRIDIDGLDEAELIDLNRCVVERLRLLQQMKAHLQMMEFRVGDRVCFHPPGRGTIAGMLTRYNRKTVTVITDSGEQWNVAPAVLLRVEEAASKPTQTIDNVVALPKKRRDTRRPREER